MVSLSEFKRKYSISLILKINLKANKNPTIRFYIVDTTTLRDELQMKRFLKEMFVALRSSVMCVCLLPLLAFYGLAVDLQLQINELLNHAAGETH